MQEYRVVVLVVATVVVSITGQAPRPPTPPQNMFEAQLACEGLNRREPQFSLNQPLIDVCEGKFWLNVKTSPKLPSIETRKVVFYWADRCLPAVPRNSTEQARLGIKAKSNSVQVNIDLRPGRPTRVNGTEFSGVEMVDVNSNTNCFPGCFMVALAKDGATEDKVVASKDMVRKQAECGTKNTDVQLNVTWNTATFPGQGRPGRMNLQPNSEGHLEAPLADLISDITVRVPTTSSNLPPRPEVVPYTVAVYITHHVASAYHSSHRIIKNQYQQPQGECFVPELTVADEDVAEFVLHEGITAGQEVSLAAMIAGKKIVFGQGHSCPVCGNATLVVSFDPANETEDFNKCNNIMMRNITINCEAMEELSVTQIAQDVQGNGKTLYMRVCHGPWYHNYHEYQSKHQSWQTLSVWDIDVFDLMRIKANHMTAKRIQRRAEANGEQLCQSTKTQDEENQGIAPLPSSYDRDGCLEAFKNLLQNLDPNAVLDQGDVDQTMTSCQGNKLIQNTLNFLRNNTDVANGMMAYLAYEFGGGDQMQGYDSGNGEMYKKRKKRQAPQPPPMSTPSPEDELTEDRLKRMYNIGDMTNGLCPEASTFFRREGEQNFDEEMANTDSKLIQDLAKLAKILQGHGQGEDNCTPDTELGDLTCAYRKLIHMMQSPLQLLLVNPQRRKNYRSKMSPNAARNAYASMTGVDRPEMTDCPVPDFPKPQKDEAPVYFRVLEKYVQEGVRDEFLPTNICWKTISVMECPNCDYYAGLSQWATWGDDDDMYDDWSNWDEWGSTGSMGSMGSMGPDENDMPMYRRKRSVQANLRRSIKSKNQKINVKRFAKNAENVKKMRMRKSPLGA